MCSFLISKLGFFRYYKQGRPHMRVERSPGFAPKKIKQNLAFRYE
nr:MAG TPA: hypothetical protein [Caudoviricetes sp.]